MSEMAENVLLGTPVAAVNTEVPKAKEEQNPIPDPDPWKGEDWQKLVPDKFKDEQGTLKNKDLAKSYVELEKRFGAGEAPPKTAEEYKIDVKLPAGVEAPEGQHKEFFQKCHAAGMSNKQLQLVMNQYSGILAKLTDDKDITVKGLKDKWNESYDENMGFAHKALMTLVDEPDREIMLKAGNNPAVIKLLAKLGRELQEDKPPSGDGGGTEAEDIDALQKSKAYWDPKDPEHNKVKAKVTAFYSRKKSA